MVNLKVLPREQIIQIQERQIYNVIVKFDLAARIIQNAWKNYKQKKQDAEFERKIEIIIRKEIAAQIIQDCWRRIK
jgi:hypothetical protein